MSTSILLSRGGITPPLDGFTPVFMQTGADPSAGAGLDLPPGSLAQFGAVYFWKVDVGPTAWVTTPFSGGGGGGGITNVTGTNGVTVTTPVAGVKNASNDLVTGTSVAQVNAVAAGSATIHAVTGIALTSTGATSDITSSSGRDDLHTPARTFSVTAAGATAIQLSATHATAGDIVISSAHGDITLTASDDGKILAHAAGLAEVTGSGVRVVSNTATQLILGSGANTLIDAGGNILATAGGNFSFTANAASNGGVVFTSDGTGTMVFTTAGGTGDIAVSSGNNLSLSAAGTGGILLDTKGTGVVAANSIVLNSDEDFTVHTDDDVSIAADDAMTLGAGGNMLLDVTGTVELSSQGNMVIHAQGAGADVSINAADRINIVSTNLCTLGSNLGGVLLAGQNVTITSAAGDLEINIDGGSNLVIDFIAGGTFSIFGGIGKAQQSTITLPTGGTVQDAEARAWIGVLQGALQAWGWMEP